MSKRPIASRKPRPLPRHDKPVLPRATRNSIALGKRARGRGLSNQAPYVPPEDWHEPQGESDGYQIIVQEPGPGMRHCVTPEQVRARLAELPEHLVEPLEVVQFSRMTRKKRNFPCYGMQWGTTVYLYPLEESLVEHFGRPPRPNEYNEARMFGGRWVQDSESQWRLIWTPKTIRDFYLNNVLIHELGHVLDTRNGSYNERERYAEWFAIHHGYLPTNSRRKRKKQRQVTRRHHSK